MSDDSTQQVRVRIAPSPTGTIHLGLARTALFNWAFARSNNGVFVLRSEDTDKERSTAESERLVLEGLGWLGLEWDEGPDCGGPYAPYRQSERVEGHKARALALLEAGQAYRCFCNAERLENMRESQREAKQPMLYDRHCAGLSAEESKARAEAGEKHVVRFRVPNVESGETHVDDMIRGKVTFKNREVDDWIMLRSDGDPTYNFVVVCDDIDMHISHVLRGEEHLVNTPKQVLLYAALGAEVPRFGHLPLMLGKDKKKLSKRSNDVSLQDYRDGGYPKAAIINFLCLQGWALDGETEVFSVEQFVQGFRPEDVSKGGSIFDLDKFRWLAGDYIRHEELDELSDHCAPFMVSAGHVQADEVAPGGAKREWFKQLVASERERIEVYADLPENTAYLFATDDQVPMADKALKNARKQADFAGTLEAFSAWLKPRLEANEPVDSLRDAAKAWVGERGIKFGVLFQPLRCVLTGKAGGADLFDVIHLLGAEHSLARIEHGTRRLSEVVNG